MTPTHDEYLDAVRAAVQETVNGRIDRLAKNWEQRFDEHRDYCRIEREHMEERMTEADSEAVQQNAVTRREFQQFLEGEWRPVKRVVLDTMAFLRIAGKVVGAVAAMLGVVAVSLGIAAALGLL
jgi:hypothetical protein